MVCVIFLSSSARLYPFRFANKIRQFRSVVGEKRSEREKYAFLIPDCKILLILRVAQIYENFEGLGEKPWDVAEHEQPTKESWTQCLKSLLWNMKSVTQKTKVIFLQLNSLIHSAAVGLCFNCILQVYLVGTSVLWASTLCPVFCLLPCEPHHGFIFGSFYPSRWGM